MACTSSSDKKASAARLRPLVELDATKWRDFLDRHVGRWTSRLRIEIGDNGPGVPEDLLPHIFTPFFSTKKGERGIGLALVRQLVHGNGGTVRHVRPVGGAARFVVSF